MTQDAKNYIAEIHLCLSKAQDLYDSLSFEDKQEIVEFHNEAHSLPHCLRWGEQASREILED